MGGGLVFDLDAQADDGERHGLREGGRKRSQADQVFFGGDERGGTGGEGCGYEAGEVKSGIAMMIGEDLPESKFEASRFEAGEELFRAGDTAEGGYGAFDSGDFHGAAQAQDGALPAPCA